MVKTATLLKCLAGSNVDGRWSYFTRPCLTSRLKYKEMAHNLFMLNCVRMPSIIERNGPIPCPIFEKSSTRLEGVESDASAKFSNLVSTTCDPDLKVDRFVSSCPADHLCQYVSSLVYNRNVMFIWCNWRTNGQGQVEKIVSYIDGGIKICCAGFRDYTIDRLTTMSCRIVIAEKHRWLEVFDLSS